MKAGKYLDVKSSLLRENALLKLGIVLFGIAVRIPLIPASDSSRSRSPIPRDPGHPFQMMAAR